MNDIVTLFQTYLLTEKCVSKNTFAAYKNDMDQFIVFLQAQQVSLDALNTQIVKDFIYHVAQQGTKPRTIARKVSTLKVFFGYLHERFGYQNHAQELVFPKLDQRLPSVLSEEDIEQLFELADKDQSNLGFRNKVMLYLLYVSGMRISELVNLTIEDIRFDTGFISVIGKGGKARMIPLPQEMLYLLDLYLKTVHAQFTAHAREERISLLFPTLYASKVRPITRQSFWIILHDLWKRSGISKQLSPHVLRHSFATHMLHRGADLRSLQLLLGHERVTTVEIYTHVETSQLRQMYDKKHPRS